MPASLRRDEAPRASMPPAPRQIYAALDCLAGHTYAAPVWPSFRRHAAAAAAAGAARPAAAAEADCACRQHMMLRDDCRPATWAIFHCFSCSIHATPNRTGSSGRRRAYAAALASLMPLALAKIAHLQLLLPPLAQEISYAAAQSCNTGPAHECCRS